MQFENLNISKPLELKNMKVKNRIVRSATHSMLGNLDGTISTEELKMYDELASNEIGLIIAGQFFVSKDGIVSPGSNELVDQNHIVHAKKIMDVVEPYNTSVIAQLNHAGGRAYSEDPFGPSAFDLGDGRAAREMTLEEIERVKNDFINAASHAKEAGMHGIQLHGAHGYILCQFLKPSVNKRTDAYGGSGENRFRLVGEIVEGIKQKCGDDFPVFIKLDSNDLEAPEVYDADIKAMVGKLEELGIEAIEFSGSEFGMKKFADRNYFLDRAMEIKGSSEVKTMVVGGVRTFKDMETVLGAGADMVSLARPFISEPDLITRLKNGQEKARCVTCGKCVDAGRDRCILNKKK